MGLAIPLSLWGQNDQAKTYIQYKESNLQPYIYATTSPITPKRVINPLDWYKSGQLVNFGVNDNGSCVEYIQFLLGYNGLNGNAIEWIQYINSSTPRIGSVAVFNNKPLGHIAMIKDIDWENNEFLVTERNFNYQKYIVNERWISINNPTISGYINQN